MVIWKLFENYLECCLEGMVPTALCCAYSWDYSKKYVCIWYHFVCVKLNLYFEKLRNYVNYTWAVSSVLEVGKAHNMFYIHLDFLLAEDKFNVSNFKGCATICKRFTSSNYSTSWKLLKKIWKLVGAHEMNRKIFTCNCCRCGGIFCNLYEFLVPLFIQKQHMKVQELSLDLFSLKFWLKDNCERFWH